MTRTTVAPAFPGADRHLEEDRAAIPAIVAAVTAAGEALRREFDPNPRPRDYADITRLMGENDALSLGSLRDGLQRLRPTAGWVDDEDAVGALPPGEWWVTDPVEGNINKAHGLTEFSVTATLVRDNNPVLAVVHLPMIGDTFTAVAGAGATQNGVPLRVSPKIALSGAFVATSQNGPDGATAESMAQLGRSVSAMLKNGAIVRVAPPPTLQLVQVAAGRLDAFWQFGDERAGLLAGGLMVSEAGGTVTDLDGRPWTLASAGIVAANPDVHTAATELLSATSPERLP